MNRILVVAVMLAAFVAYGADQKPAKFPENKWFNGVDGLEDAKLLQKEFGADIFIYFARYSPNDQKGLCHWFEKSGMGQAAVSKYLRDYLKVKIELPLNKKDTEAVASFNVNKCPAIFILPNGSTRSQRVAVFDWAGNQPKPLAPDVMIEAFRAVSSEKYKVPAE